MKTILFSVATLFFSTKIMAQSSIIQPELFSLPNSIDPGNFCTATNNGKMYFNTNIDGLAYCIGNNASKRPKELWSANGADIYYLGKVGFSNINPTYDLDVGGTTRSQNLIVNGNLGINTPTPTEKFEIKDREITIRSTADNYNWRIRNSDASDILQFIDHVIGVFNVNYGGNISIGNVNNTQKLWVQGDVGYAGNLTVEGKGVVSNTNANQLVMHTVTSTITGNTFFVSNNTCVVATFGFPNGFTASPAVFLGQNLSNTQKGDNLIKSIINVTSSGGSIQFCNQTGGVVGLDNQTFSVMAIGQ